MKKLIYITILSVLVSAFAQGQNTTTHPPDSTQQWNMHFQMTVIDQSHPAFSAAYSGLNSLNNSEEEALSLTTTLYIGKKLWKGASLYFDPEIAGGTGVSEARGVAGYTNGETFRIGNATPELYLARLFYRQYIALSGPEHDKLTDEDINQLKEYVPEKRLVITAGKMAVSDFFDANAYSHDPRMQFINWSLMSNAAWDYAANTRGYTDGVVLEYISPTWEARAAFNLEPTYANGPELDYHFLDAHSQTIEICRHIKPSGHNGVIRLMAFRNVSKAPAYRDVINAYLNHTDPSLDVIYGKSYGGVKYGFGLNAEQELTDNLGMFLRGSWNDGKTATWAYTEIDRTASLGLNYNGKKYNRPDDNFGVAGVINGISADHRDFLNIGGYGFIIGDGKLTNYSAEKIVEAYYSAKINKTLYLSGDYQFVDNPAYNADRGPVSVFSIRVHVEF